MIRRDSGSQAAHEKHGANEIPIREDRVYKDYAGLQKRSGFSHFQTR
jgi:hypothetical protein